MTLLVQWVLAIDDVTADDKGIYRFAECQCLVVAEKKPGRTIKIELTLGTDYIFLKKSVRN